MEHDFTMVPNYLFAHLLILPASQLKVLLFILRRTLGWHKAEDTISLSQFENGVGESEEGTGLARSTVISAIQGLEARGLIRVSRVTAVAGDAAPSIFRLGPMFKTTVVPQTGHGVARKSDPQIENLSKYKPSSKHANPVKNMADDDDVSRMSVTSDLGTEPRLQPNPIEPVEGLESQGSVKLVNSLFVHQPEKSPIQLAAAVTSECQSHDQAPLLARLMSAPLGYSHRTATQILERFSTERVEAGLDGLMLRSNIRNPAGYLLCELQAGDYASPSSRSAGRRTLLYAVPSSPEKLKNPETIQEDEVRLQAAIASLAPDVRAALMQEVRAQYARMKHTSIDKIPEDSLWVISAFESRVQELMKSALAA